MKELRRARLVLLVAAIAAVAILLTGLPLGEIGQQQQKIGAASGELSLLTAHNRQVEADISSLARSSTIESIARKEYGLVFPGQRAFAVLPVGAGGSGAASSRSGFLGGAQVSPTDLAAGDSAALAGSGIAGTPDPARTQNGPGVWSRALSHLEFWRWAF